MPPIRSITAATKPVKTERTHEENQERAYIAASRRSDRSLEARIESARRASEIHKRRTGRSLRVTEQDVVNEEMYEEEDDDLPMQYRRLTAHLNNNSSDFNRRLAAYLTNHVAMRSALDQAISSSYAQQQNTDQRSNNTPNMQPPWQPSPGLAQYSSQMVPPHMLHRQSPYPNTSLPGYRPRMKLQSSSNGPDQQQSKPKMTSRSEDRRASAPVPPRHSSSGSEFKRSPGLNTMHRPASVSSLSNTDMPAEDEDSPLTAFSQPSMTNPPLFSSHSQTWPSSQSMSISPLSTTLPPETRMFFGAGFGSSDAYSNSMYNGSKGQEPLYQSPDHSCYNNSGFAKPYFDGMSQTLAPGPFDSVNIHSWPTPLSATTDNASTPACGINYNMDDGFDGDMFGGKQASFLQDSLFGGQLTPADNDWAALIDTNSWDDNDTRDDFSGIGV